MHCEPLEPTLDGLFCPPDGPAKTPPWQEAVSGLTESAQACGGKSPASWVSSVPRGSWEKTSLGFYPSTPVGIWRRFFRTSIDSDISLISTFLTPKTMAFHNAERGSHSYVNAPILV